MMVYNGSKGWYVQQLKNLGITKHPIEQRKLELYKTFVVRNLYFETVEKRNEDRKDNHYKEMV